MNKIYDTLGKSSGKRASLSHFREQVSFVSLFVLLLCIKFKIDDLLQCKYLMNFEFSESHIYLN